MENNIFLSVDELFMHDKIVELIMSDMNLGVVIIDRNKRILEISDLACKVFGFSKNQLRAQRFDELFQSMPIEYHFIQQSMLDGVVYRNYPMTYSNGFERFELLIDTNMIRDEEHSIIGMCVTFKDVTNLRSLEEQVIRSERLATIGQIAAGAAHEIRNPLTSIKGFLQLFERKFAALPESKEQNYIRIMMKEIDRINQLVGEFLLLSKHQEPKWQIIDLIQTLDEIYPVIQTQAHFKNVTIELVQSEFPLLVIANPEMFKQVMINLCKNGIEAMPNGGHLRVEMKKMSDDQHIGIRVCDTGYGIAPYLLDKIFDPFFTTKSDGTGLGLSICQRIIHDIGGQIRVQSKGFGTTFEIKIPLAKANDLH